jgi:hypothetical protein
MGNQPNRIAYVFAEPWIFVLVVVCMAILAVVQRVYPNRLRNLFRTVFNQRITQQIMREEAVFSHRASWLLLLVSALSLSAITYLAGRYLGYAMIPKYYGYLLGLLVLFFVFRQIMRALFGLISGNDAGFTEFNFVSAAIYKALGLLLLPLLVLIGYLPRELAIAGFYLGIGVLLLAMLYRLIRGWRVGRTHRHRSFYMIFYLCALELMPSLLVLKLLISNAPNP